MALEVWYQQVPDSDEAAGDPAIILTTTDDVDRFVRRVSQASASQSVPSMVEVSIAGDEDAPMMNVGIGATAGFVHWLGDESSMSVGDPDKTGTVTYDYAGHPAELPASAEIPLEQVRQAVHEYLTTGKRADSITWRTE